MGVPSSSSDSALQRVQSFTSPVLADPSGCLPVRPTSSSARKGIPVPSLPRYRVCGRGRASRGSLCTRSSAAICFPRASAVLSTCWASTATPASSVNRSLPSVVDQFCVAESPEGTSHRSPRRKPWETKPVVTRKPRQGRHFGLTYSNIVHYPAFLEADQGAHGAHQAREGWRKRGCFLGPDAPRGGSSRGRSKSSASRHAGVVGERVRTGRAWSGGRP